jgi:hypothetical protein
MHEQYWAAIRPMMWRSQLGPIAKAARWPKPVGARCACPVRGHRARDWHGGAAVGVGNDDKLGRNGRGGHQQGKASLLGKVVGSGTHRGDTATWRRREAVVTMEFNGGEVLRWGTAATEGSCGTPTTPGR